MARAQEVERRQATQMDELHRGMESARAEVSRLVEQMRAVEEDFLAAEAQYRLASTSAKNATASFEQARRYYVQAETDYRRSAFVLVVAAGVDSLGSVLCGSTVSTQAYRKQLAREGIQLEGVDVDHIWPRARGGADHPWNYQLLPEKLNRSLGASLWEKFTAWPLETVRGLLVSALLSLRCGG
ncbi:MAG TPA: hypothetical protein VEZ71_30460 [Archangium sp.]|nr:hypothetical protein [Archangium sp.]